MKKILGICIVGLFILGAVVVPANGPTTPTANQSQQNRVFTHKVLVEDGTRVSCPYCPYARQALSWLYNNGNYPFYYVCLVFTYNGVGNTHASQRCSEYNLYGAPTAYFDGGYKVSVGAGSEPSAETNYRTYLNQSGARVPANVDIQLTVNWLGSATMDITAKVWNNDTTTYTGKIRVYVCEDKSTLGWVDTTGHPYTMAFLDYAQNQNLSIPASSTWTNTNNWIGANHNDGNGHTFANIQYGNIMVVGALFNPEWHQGYSYPPSSYPFSAYYVDDTTGVQVGTFVNSPPGTPTNPNPANGATNVLINTQCTCSCSNPDGDFTKYNIYFGTTNPPPFKAQQTTLTYSPGTLLHNTTYYWKVAATDEWGATTEGPVWSFTTIPNRPPNAPSSPNPANGATNVPINKDLSWTCSDPDGEALYYDVYFGTTNPPPRRSTHQTATTWDTGNMDFETTYYWKIVASDNDLNTSSPVWSFTTGAIPDTTPPTVRILKPLSGYLYFNDNDGFARIILTTTLIIKKITITVNATDYGSGIGKIQFFIDDKIVGNATSEPYQYVWDISGGFLPKPHVIKVTAYDQASNLANATISVKKML